MFADNEYVLGYELINEPWAGITKIALYIVKLIKMIIGDIFDHPKLLIPGVADEDVLAPAYEVVSCLLTVARCVTIVVFYFLLAK